MFGGKTINPTHLQARQYRRRRVRVLNPPKIDNEIIYKNV